MNFVGLYPAERVAEGVAAFHQVALMSLGYRS